MIGRLYKKHLLFLALLGLLFVAGQALVFSERPIPGRPKGLVNDFAQVIPPVHEQKIVAVTAELLQKTRVPVVIVTMPDIGGAEYNDYANRLYEKWGIGEKGVDKGVLIFVTVKERKMRIETGYGVEGILPDGLVGDIRDRYMIPYLKQNKFGEGILNGTLAVAQIIAKDASVQLTGYVPPRQVKKRRSGLSIVPFILVIVAILFFSRGRGGLWLLLPLLLGGGGGRGYGGSSGGFGGFSGGFGGFGGGMSGGGGAGGSF